MIEQSYSQVAQPLKSTDFDELQDLIKRVVPSDLKDFYITQNGGIPSLSAIQNISFMEFDIRHFLPIKYKFNEIRPTVEGHYKGLFLMGEPTFHKKCIPIGFTELGDGIYYSLEKEDFGSIFYYVHDASHTQHYRPVASSLKLMLQNLVMSERT